MLNFIERKFFKENELNKEFEKAIEHFLAKNELYESDPKIREAEPWLKGDKELIKYVLNLEEKLNGKESNSIENIPKSISQEEDSKKVLSKYIELYKNKDIDQGDFLYFLWIFFLRYMSINYLIKELRNDELIKRLQKMKEIHEEKALIDLTSTNKKDVIETMLMIQNEL